MMTREQRERANRLVETLLDVSPEKRQSTLESIVESLGDGADEIRAEVERLLQEDDAVVERLATLGPMIEANTRIAGVTRTAGNRILNDARDHVPSVIGRYHLRGPLGNGGMGVVYLAEQRAPIARTVAIKLVRAGFDTHEVIARFEAERQALARMDHAHIARVFDAGMTDAGRPYFVMEYVPGVSITDYADRERLNIHDRLRLFALVCDALSHAHMKGVIHRDLKPSNVLAFTGEDGKPVVKVIDFGIAKALTPGDRLGKTTHFTVPNLVLGTYEYMSPEQAAGNGDIDTRSDVYSLGVLLYELLSGLKPFERGDFAGQTDEELRRLIRDVEPPRPSTRLMTLMKPKTIVARPATGAQNGTSGATETRERSPESIATARQSDPRALVRTLQRELEWIPMMAMRKDRTRRYGSAAELAADVRNCLAGLPLVAAPESRLYRARKFVVGHRRAITLAAAVVALLVAGVIGTGIGLVRESAARRLADANRTLASRSAYRSAIAAADVALRTGDGVSLRWALDSAPADLRGWEWKWLSQSGNPAAVELQRENGERYAESIALPDNRRAWTMLRNKTGWLLWDLQTGKPIRCEQGPKLAVTNNGRTFAIVRADGAIEVADVDSGAPIWRVAPTSGHPWKMSSAAFTSDGATLMAWDGSNMFTRFDVATGAQRRLPTRPMPKDAPGFVEYDGVDPRAAVFSSEESFNLLAVNIDTGVVSQPARFDYVLHRVPVKNTGTGQLRTLGNGAVTYNVPQRSHSPAMAILPHSKVIAVPQENGSALLCGIQPATPTDATVAPVAPAARRVIVSAAPIEMIEATPDERRLIVTMRDGSVRACPIDMPAEIAAPYGGVSGCAISPDRKKIVVVDWGMARCFDLMTGVPLWSHNIGPYVNRHVAWSPDGTRIAIATDPLPAANDPLGLSPKSEFFVLDANGEQIAAFSSSAVRPDPSHPAEAPEWTRGLRGMEFSADGRHLLLAKLGGSPTRIDTTNWTPVADGVSATTQPVTVQAPALRNMYAKMKGTLLRSPGGKRLAEIVGGETGGNGQIDPSLTIRDAGSLKVIRRIAFNDGVATAVAWSNSEREVAAAFTRPDDVFVGMFDVDTGKERYRVITPDNSPVTAIAISPNGERIVAFTQSQRMLVIDAKTGEELMVSSTPRIVREASFLSNATLALTDDGNAMLLLESENSESAIDSTVAMWPATLARPSSVAEARRAAWKANTAIEAAHDKGLDPTNPADAMKIEPDDAIARATLIEFAKRACGNLNSMNSTAISILLADAPSPSDMDRATRLLRMAVSLKPQSATLQGNLGSILFRLGDFAAARAPLRQAAEIRDRRGFPQDETTLLRLAIAAHHQRDADADEIRKRAMTLIGDETKVEDIDTRQLIAQMHAEFGS